MNGSWRLAARGGLAGWFAIGICLSMAVLVWFGVRAVYAWQRSEARLAEGRARDTVDRFVTVLSRDMRGAQESLSAFWQDDRPSGVPDDLRTLAASAFARYPYPESFFVWRRGAPAAAATFFNRSDRHPTWRAATQGHDRFPVEVAHDPSVASAILDRVRTDAGQGRRLSVFELELAGVPYQVVARVSYADEYRESALAVVGFTVNLRWTREHYFPDVARQVARIGHSAPVTIVDDRGEPVWRAQSAAGGTAPVRRTFPVSFFDPMQVGIASPSGVAWRPWAVEVSPESDGAFQAAMAATNRTLAVAAVAAAALALGLILATRAAIASARLSGLRSEFVSTVTHELKTPLATIRAVGDTLRRGRVADPSTYQEYAQIVVQESKRLTRLVENLLAYARITDVTEVYDIEALDLAEAARDALRGFEAQTAEGGFEIAVVVEPGLPRARADRTATRLVLDNLIDNALRYSGAARWVQIRARREGDRMVAIEVCDRGVGIPAAEVAHVTRRFFRGRGAPSSGSGLGLAIVSRIAADLGGRLEITSAVGQGTTATVMLPVAPGQP